MRDKSGARCPQTNHKVPRGFRCYVVIASFAEWRFKCTGLGIKVLQACSQAASVPEVIQLPCLMLTVWGKTQKLDQTLTWQLHTSCCSNKLKWFQWLNAQSFTTHFAVSRPHGSASQRVCASDTIFQRVI